PICTVLVVLLAPAAPANAKVLDVYDLDSLTYWSTAIVEGDMLRKYTANNLDLIDVKLTLVNKGPFKAGQTVAVTRPSLYRKHSLRSVEPLEAGDHIVMFLVRAQAQFVQPVPKDADVYVPLPSGLRLVHGEQVFEFYQPMNPGPYVIRRHAGPMDKPPTLN